MGNLVDKDAAASAAAVSDTVVQLYVNEKLVTIPNDTPVDQSLNEFLRTTLRLTGTKVMCREGGCGACVVTVTRPNPLQPSQLETLSLNSCLTPILACRDWHITTIEGIGNRLKPHAVQQQVATFNATQCGYCTPGFCMQQYTLLQQTGERGNPAKQDIENAFDGNLCRCTGYRPILDAMKSFASEKIIRNKNGLASADVEDLAKFVSLTRSAEKPLIYQPVLKNSASNNKTEADAAVWFAPNTLEQLWQILPNYNGKKVRFVGGHTGHGVYPNDGPYDAYIDLKAIKDLYAQTITPKSIEIGSLTTLKSLIDLFNNNAKTAGFSYLSQIAAHLQRVASSPVRCAASWAGNLMLKKQHPEFPSDVFVCFAAAGAQLVLASAAGNESPISMETFLQSATKLDQKIIKNVILQPLSTEDGFYYSSFKVMPREQNAHALVNAAMCVQIDSKSTAGVAQIVGKPVVVFGNVAPDFVHASATEVALVGVKLNEWSTSSGVMNVFDVLRNEIKPAADPFVSDQYRQSLCVMLMYRLLLSAAQQYKIPVGPQYISAASRIDRPISSGAQSFGTDKEQWPVTQPIPKLEALIQATGEAEYITDMLPPPIPSSTGCLHAQPVLAPAGPAQLLAIDTSAAEKVPGFVQFVSSQQIPGENNSYAASSPHVIPLMAKADGMIDYAGQALGFVLAETEKAARQAADAVIVQLKQTRAPVLSCEDAIRTGSFYPNAGKPVVVGDAQKAIDTSQYKIKGEVRFGGQFHFHMETQVALCTPKDDGSLVLDASTQWPDMVQMTAAAVCGIPQADVDVQVRRIGGAYGAKITGNNYIAAMAALGSHLTRRPVKMHLTLADNMRMLGMRHAYYFQYEVGVDSNQHLQGIKMNVYCDAGTVPSYPYGDYDNQDNTYKCLNWSIQPFVCKTDKPAAQACRAPGTTEIAFIIEHIMDHCAYELGVDPLEFRQANFYQLNDKDTLNGMILDKWNIPQVMDGLETQAAISDRKKQIQVFNQANRWKKRAMSVVPLKYHNAYNGITYATLVNVHHADGTVSISHGGIEIGQGVNTKAAQVVAREFNIPLETVRVKPTISVVAGNGITTGGSITSESVARCAIECCRAILARMKPVRDALGPNAKWQDIVAKCYAQSIDICERQWINGANYQPATRPDAYEVYSAMAVEVELDVLTGERQIRRLDLVYDCGESVSPLVDIGQAEGAIVMGLGLYTSERLQYDSASGALMTAGTWEYKPPSSKDIPVDMRVTFLQNLPNSVGMLRSKVIGEPPLNMACAVVFALRQAVDEARRDAQQHFSIKNKMGSSSVSMQKQSLPWVQLDSPATCEQVQQLCNVQNYQLKI